MYIAKRSSFSVLPEYFQICPDMFQICPDNFGGGSPLPFSYAYVRLLLDFVETQIFTYKFRIKTNTRIVIEVLLRLQFLLRLIRAFTWKIC